MPDLPEPWEGVSGVHRDTWLLSLADEADEHRRALMRITKSLRKALIVGNPAPVVTDLWGRLSRPVPGDLVVEITRAMYRLDYQGIGILLARREEKDCGEVWYVQYGNSPRDIARWENCDFMTIVPVEELECPITPVAAAAASA